MYCGPWALLITCEGIIIIIIVFFSFLPLLSQAWGHFSDEAPVKLPKGSDVILPGRTPTNSEVKGVSCQKGR